MKTYFLLAGEASGDMHASRLIEELHLIHPDACFVGLGGDKMREAGCEIFVDYREMAYMGVISVLQNLTKILHNFRKACQMLCSIHPDVLILIDYPSFNLRIAKFCRQHFPNIKIVYYIPPKVWAWKAWRIHKIARLSDRVLGIFPFETDYYARYGYSCHYVGNPTVETIQKVNYPIIDSTDGKKIIALLPGSRRSEISHCLPTMLAAARTVAGSKYRIVVAQAPAIEEAFYRSMMEDEHLTQNTYALLHTAHAAIVNSGTATLETALIGCPQTAVYYIACSRWLQWLLEPILFRMPWYTLVNILLQKNAIQELIARNFTQENIEKELTRLVSDESYRSQIISYYRELHSLLGTQSAARNAARVISTL